MSKPELLLSWYIYGYDSLPHHDALPCSWACPFRPGFFKTFITSSLARKQSGRLSEKFSFQISIDLLFHRWDCHTSAGAFSWHNGALNNPLTKIFPLKYMESLAFHHFSHSRLWRGLDLEEQATTAVTAFKQCAALPCVQRVMRQCAERALKVLQSLLKAFKFSESKNLMKFVAASSTEKPSTFSVHSQFVSCFCQPLKVQHFLGCEACGLCRAGSALPMLPTRPSDGNNMVTWRISLQKWDFSSLAQTGFKRSSKAAHDLLEHVVASSVLEQLATFVLAVWPLAPQRNLHQRCTYTELSKPDTCVIVGIFSTNQYLVSMLYFQNRNIERASGFSNPFSIYSIKWTLMWGLEFIQVHSRKLLWSSTQNETVTLRNITILKDHASTSSSIEAWISMSTEWVLVFSFHFWCVNASICMVNPTNLPG